MSDWFDYNFLSDFNFWRGLVIGTLAAYFSVWRLLKRNQEAEEIVLEIAGAKYNWTDIETRSIMYAAKDEPRLMSPKWTKRK